MGLLGATALLVACAHTPTTSTNAQKDASSSAFPSFTSDDKLSASHAVTSSQDVLFHAMSLIGTPYQWGGNTPDSGFDCSGLIRYVFDKSANVSLPRTTAQMWNKPARKIKQKNLQSGDVVFFSTNGRGSVSHAGIYVGEGRFIHAPSTGGKVRLDHLSNSYWQSAYLSAKRYVD